MDPNIYDELIPEVGTHLLPACKPKATDMIDESRFDGCPVLDDPFRVEGERGEGSKKRAIHKLSIAIVLCVIFMIAEVVGGKISGSLAIITDATHLLSDVAGFLISLFAITWSRKTANASMSYGYHRAEILGALGSISLVWAITFYLLVEAWERLQNPIPINGPIMVVVALFGVVVNAVIGLVLHEHHHAHQSHEISHGLGTDGGPHPHESGLGIESGRSPGNTHGQPNINVRAAFIHAVGDLIQSVGVLIAALIIWYRPEWRIADLFCTILFSILVLGSTWFLARDTIHILMEGTPAEICPRTLREQLAQVEGVMAVHDLHVWSLAPGKASATVHVVIDWERQIVDPDLYMRVLSQCQHVVCSHNVHHATIQIDPETTSAVHCRTDCCGSNDNFITNREPYR